MDSFIDVITSIAPGFQHLHFPDSARDVPGEDLQLKLKILDLADGIRTYTTPTAGRRPLVDLALDFMNLCSFAVAKVSKTRWFEIGAICTRLAVADYQIQTNDDDGHPPEGLLKLCSWAPDDPGLSSRWTDVQWKFVDKPPTAGGIPTVSSPVPQLTGSDLLMMMGEFLYDLMMTLDEPILIQLERGRLRDLTREETNSLLERVGMTMRSTR